MKPPRFYDKTFEKIEETIVEMVKQERIDKHLSFPPTRTDRQKRAASIIAEKRLTTREPNL